MGECFADGKGVGYRRFRLKRFSGTQDISPLSTHVPAEMPYFIPDLVGFLRERVRGITIQFYYPFPGTRDMALSPQERVAVLDRLIILKREGLPVVDSFKALEALKDNSWHCHSWLIASAEPDGTIIQGCYLKNRAEIACERCGFAAHTEISLAYEGDLGALATAQRTFGFV